MSGDDIQRLISIFSNGFVTFPALIGIVMTGGLLLTRREELSKSAANLCMGLFLQSAGEIVRISYWFPAIWLSRAGQHYHPWFIENRFLSYGLSLPLLVIGTLKILHELFPKRHWLINRMLALGFVLAVVLTVIFQASEMGYLDRDHAIDLFESVVPISPDYVRPR